MANYHTVYPVANKQAGYGESENIDFVLAVPNGMLVPNSIRISGNLTAGKPGVFDDADKYFYDPACGIHAFFSKISTEIAQSISGKGSIVEDLLYYPQWVRMAENNKRSADDIVGSLKDSIELKAGGEFATKFIMKGDDDGITPFSFRPDICLNNMNAPLSFDRDAHFIKISVRTSLYNQVFYGDSNSAGNAIFTLTDLRMEFMTVPENGEKQPIEMIVKHNNTRQLIQSSLAHLSVHVPSSNVMSVSVAFTPKDNVNNKEKNEWNSRLPPALTKVEWAFRNATNTLVSYPLESREEILANYVKSFNGKLNKNQLVWSKINSDRVGGVGLWLNGPVDFNKTPLSLQVHSGVSTNNSMYATMFFQTVRKL